MTVMSDGSITRFKSEELRFAALDTVSTAVCSGSFAESGNLVPLPLPFTASVFLMCRSLPRPHTRDARGNCVDCGHVDSSTDVTDTERRQDEQLECSWLSPTPSGNFSQQRLTPSEREHGILPSSKYPKFPTCPQQRLIPSPYFAWNVGTWDWILCSVFHWT